MGGLTSKSDCIRSHTASPRPSTEVPVGQHTTCPPSPGPRVPHALKPQPLSPPAGARLHWVSQAFERGPALNLSSRQHASSVFSFALPSIIPRYPAQTTSPQPSDGTPRPESDRLVVAHRQALLGLITSPGSRRLPVSPATSHTPSA